MPGTVATAFPALPYLICTVSYEVGIILVPILWMKNLRRREGK